MHHRLSPTFAALALALPLHAEVIDLRVDLDGDQQSPAVDTLATGAGTLAFDTVTAELTWSITFSGLEGTQTAAHFHGPALLCETGAIQIPLPLGSPLAGNATLDPAQADDLLAGRWYLNVHTDLHPGGEIRGQIVPARVFDPIPAPIPPSPVHVRLETVATGLTAPNWGTFAPGIPGRLFVTDQAGQIVSVDLDTGATSTFLDVGGRLVPLGLFGEGTFDERGLLGIAFADDYATSGHVYTYTSEPAVGAPTFPVPAGVTPDHHATIIEWTVPDPAAPGAVVDPGSARVLLTVAEPQFNHNAGAVLVGPDGLLYIALGDGGGADDKDGQPFVGGVPIDGHGCGGNGQNAENVLGSILRIDPAGSDGPGGQYGIPAANPFVAPGDPRTDEIFAYGFRNPFRMSFDAATGLLYVADVGQNDIEEVNVVVKGGNYGWNRKEGTFTFINAGNQPGYVTDRFQDGPSGLLDPVAEYDHDEGIAIVGGFVYRGVAIAPLAGRYVFGDFAQTFSNDGRLFHLDAAHAVREFPLVGQSDFGHSLLGFGEDANGEIYVMVNDTGVPFETTGAVLKLTTRIGDFDADGVTEFGELLQLLSAWGPCGVCPEDIDGDGVVGLGDLLLLLSNWG